MLIRVSFVQEADPFLVGGRAQERMWGERRCRLACIRGPKVGDTVVFVFVVNAVVSTYRYFLFSLFVFSFVICALTRVHTFTASSVASSAAFAEVRRPLPWRTHGWADGGGR